MGEATEIIGAFPLLKEPPARLGRVVRGCIKGTLFFTVYDFVTTLRLSTALPDGIRVDLRLFAGVVNVIPRIAVYWGSSFCVSQNETVGNSTSVNVSLSLSEEL